MHGAQRASWTDMQDPPFIQYARYQFYIKMHMMIYLLLHEQRILVSNNL